MSSVVDQYIAQLHRMLGRSAAADQVIREARSHLDDKVAALIKDGKSPEDAARDAITAFGDAREFAFNTLASGGLDATPPALLRWVMFAGTTVTGLIASFLFIALILTAIFGGDGESTLVLTLFGSGAAITLLHALAFAHLLLRRRQRWMFRSAVFLGGIGLLAISGAAVLGSELDDSPGGMLLGFLLAAQGGAAVLTVAFPQLVPQRRTVQV